MSKKETTIIVSTPDLLTIGLSEIIYKNISCTLIVTTDLGNLTNVHGNILLITTPDNYKRNRANLEGSFPPESNLKYLPFKLELQPITDDYSLNLFDKEKQIHLKIKNALSSIEQVETEKSNELSRREKEVLLLVSRGLSNKELADKLSVSIHTIISHRKNISEKIGIKTASGMAMYAVFKKIIDIDDIQLSELI